MEALELRRRGFRVGYIAAGDAADPRLVDAGVELLLLSALSVFEEPDNSKRLQMLFENPFVKQPVSEFLERFPSQQTIVHIHSYRLKLSGAPIHVAQQLGFRTVFHCHEYATICPTSLYYDHRASDNCQRKPMSFACVSCECQGQKWRHKLPKLTSHFGNQTLRGLYRKADMFIAVSELSAQILRPHLPKEPVTLIAPHTGPNHVSAAQNAPVGFGYIGRLVPEKAPDTFLAAAKNASVPAVVIGDGPMLADLRSRYPDASFTGWLDDSQLEKELSGLRALVVPSRWRETFGLSVVDALHRGIPVITTSNVGAGELVLQSGGGIVTTDSDTDTLSAAISKLNQEEIWSEMRQSALTWSAHHQRTPEHFVSDLLQLFEPLLS